MEAVVQQETTEILDLEERSWLKRHCAGDSKAFPCLLVAYKSPVYNYLCRCGLDSGMRDELFQEVFLKIHMSASSYKPSKPLKSWLFTIVINTVRNHFRSVHRIGNTIVPIEELIADSIPIEDALDASNQLAWVFSEISKLKDNEREVIVLNTLKGFALKDIALILNIPLNTVKTHLRRARLQLSEALLVFQNQGGKL